MVLDQRFDAIDDAVGEADKAVCCDLAEALPQRRQSYLQPRQHLPAIAACRAASDRTGIHDQHGGPLPRRLESCR
jgi:hypothetical protein